MRYWYDKTQVPATDAALIDTALQHNRDFALASELQKKAESVYAKNVLHSIATTYYHMDEGDLI